MIAIPVGCSSALVLVVIVVVVVKKVKQKTTFQEIRPTEKEGGTGERDIHVIEKVDVSGIHVNTDPPKRTISSV